EATAARSGDGPSTAALLRLVRLGAPAYLVWNGPAASVILRPSYRASLTERMALAVLMGCLGSLLFFFLAHLRSGRRFVLAGGLAAAAGFWCWKLTPEPIGVLLLLLAAAALVSRARRHRLPLAPPEPAAGGAHA